MNSSSNVLVTGGAGFIGSNFILDWLRPGGEPDSIVNLDKLTYAGNPETLAPVQGSARYTFVHGDICDAALVRRLLEEFRPRAIVHFAAESHVDRSILGPEAFSANQHRRHVYVAAGGAEHFQGLDEEARSGSAFCMSQPMRCLARLSRRMLRFTKGLRIRRGRRMRRARRRATIWCGPGRIRMGCRR